MTQDEDLELQRLEVNVTRLVGIVGQQSSPPSEESLMWYASKALQRLLPPPSLVVQQPRSEIELRSS